MSGASSGHILPCCLYQSQLQSNSFHLNWMPWRAPAASITRTPSGMTSRPMPSPAMTAMLYSFICLSSTLPKFYPIKIRTMRFASFETSTDWCSVALWLDGEMLSLEEQASNRHSELVLPMLERLLAGASLGMAQLDAVAFGAGPGSFTGLRIACGVAQGIAFARDLPAIGISTL